MFFQRLYKFFFILVIVSTILLIFSWYNNYKFDSNPLSQKIEQEIKNKKEATKKLVAKHYGFDLNVPVIVTNKLSSKLYGVSVFTEDNQIIIYLNKKRFKESKQYMIEQVIPHEYAHAVMFTLRDFSKQQDGHSQKWQNICKNLNGLKCEQFANSQDIVIGKISF